MLTDCGAARPAAPVQLVGVVAVPDDVARPATPVAAARGPATGASRLDCPDCLRGVQYACLGVLKVMHVWGS